VRTISARADGAVCIGREAVPVGVFLIQNGTSAVPHNITLFVEFEISIVSESICGLFIDQRSKVLPVVVIPCVCFGTPHWPVCVICTFLFSAWPSNQRVHEA
jgi:hypothetical protein